MTWDDSGGGGDGFRLSRDRRSRRSLSAIHAARKRPSTITIRSSSFVPRLTTSSRDLGSRPRMLHRTYAAGVLCVGDQWLLCAIDVPPYAEEVAASSLSDSPRASAVRASLDSRYPRVRRGNRPGDITARRPHLHRRRRSPTDQHDRDRADRGGPSIGMVGWTRWRPGRSSSSSADCPDRTCNDQLLGQGACSKTGESSTAPPPRRIRRKPPRQHLGDFLEVMFHALPTDADRIGEFGLT